MKSINYFVPSVAAVLLMAMMACGSEAQSPVADPVTGSSGASTAMTEGEVSANNASEEDLKAAFEAAGIPNADEWAHEVEEYRPYPEDDPEFTKLRRDLAKYNPGPGVIDQIVSLLKLP